MALHDWNLDPCLQLIRIFQKGSLVSRDLLIYLKSALFLAFELLFLCSGRKWRPHRKIGQKNQFQINSWRNKPTDLYYIFLRGRRAIDNHRLVMSTLWPQILSLGKLSKVKMDERAVTSGSCNFEQKHPRDMTRSKSHGCKVSWLLDLKCF